MQGLLRDAELTVESTTGCAHCQEPMRLQVDSQLNSRVLEGGSSPLVFQPEVDWAIFTDPTIIDGY